ncbi:hypothetical protein TUN205_08023 [Pyrenophora tritici-repentis]|nr:hypothetical protein Alg215_10066 [Pyrenophora tritici-repentis]KAI0607731.1 hypothetical protein TUN205_08023 [Pyrenophora tritici-repentis]PWO21378.1 hypothetical protein PtrARCrB10_10114 [Pyrenophora tritici-repentis]
MQKISRKSLASLVCPSAPFLVPRLLRTVAPAAVASFSPYRPLQRQSYATGSEKKSRLVRKVQYAPPTIPGRSAVDIENNRLLHKFRNACETRNIESIMDLYPRLLSAHLINSYDTRRITQALHVRLRNEPQHSLHDIFAFIDRIQSDLRTHRLEPHPYAFVHLFGIYKECSRWDEGLALWRWLVQQDDQFCSQASYGAAIELMAYGNLMSLPELENLYQEGLKRFPGTFAQYHLSPDAIVPNRAELTTISGIPTILLQGILTARLLAGDWRMSYLAFDTALRIYPTQTPSRYYELFMTERPIAEAYPAFMVACRAGTRLRPTHVTALITKMRAAMIAAPKMSDRVMLLRAIANAIYAYLESGATLESIHVGNLIRSFELILPEPVAGQDYVGEAAVMRDALVLTAHDTLSGLVQAGASFKITAFEGLISLAGKMRVPSLLTATLQDIEKAGFELGTIVTRSVITSAGLLKDKDLIEQQWSRVVSTSEANSAQIPFEDWITLTKACRRADHAAYFRQQILKLAHTIDMRTERHLIQQIDVVETAPPITQGYQYMTLQDLTSELDTLKTQMKNVEAVVMSGQPLSLVKTPFYMHLDPNHASLGSLENLRVVYDELTTDPHQPPPPPPAKPTLSPTNIPVDELRFLNWVAVHEMMDSAESYQSDLEYAMKAAKDAGQPMPTRPEVLRLGNEDPPVKRTFSELRRKIKQLRGSSFPDPSETVKSKGVRRVQSGLMNPVSIPKEGEKGLQKLRYYVSMQSDHEAPFKPWKKIEIGGAKSEGSQASPL